jgi:hypothetical protein
MWKIEWTVIAGREKFRMHPCLRDGHEDAPVMTLNLDAGNISIDVLPYLTYIKYAPHTVNVHLNKVATYIRFNQ